jgi:hypothetical protein
MVGVLFGGFSAFGQEDLTHRVEDLEKELQTLKQNRDSLSGLAPWVDRVRLSGNADVTYYDGEKNSHSANSRMVVDNARLFFDFDVSETTSFYFEWDIVREAEEKNKVGQLYLRLDRLFDVDALNLKAGRLPIPFGEEYVRFHEQRFDNPLIGFSVLSPYGWDEGIELFGSASDNRIDYVVAVTDGDNKFNENSNNDLQFVGRIGVQPTSWSRISISAVDTGTVGTSDKRGISAMEFGGTHGYTVHTIGETPNFQNGAVLPDDPSLTLTLRAWEVDAIAELVERGRLWLAFGQIEMDSDGPSSYDRDLDYWIAEGVLELGQFTPFLKRYFLATRYSGIGTFDSNEGFVLGKMNEGADLGFNSESVTKFSVGLGARLYDNLKLKIEYSWYDFEMINGVTEDIRMRAEDRDLFGLSLSARF